MTIWFLASSQMFCWKLCVNFIWSAMKFRVSFPINSPCTSLLHSGLPITKPKFNRKSRVQFSKSHPLRLRKKVPKKTWPQKTPSKHPKFPSMVSPHQVYQPPRPRKWHRIHPKSTLTSLSALMPRKKNTSKLGGKGNVYGRPNFLAGRLNIYIYI